MNMLREVGYLKIALVGLELPPADGTAPAPAAAPAAPKRPDRCGRCSKARLIVAARRPAVGPAAGALMIALHVGGGAAGYIYWGDAADRSSSCRRQPSSPLNWRRMPVAPPPPQKIEEPVPEIDPVLEPPPPISELDLHPAGAAGGKGCRRRAGKAEAGEEKKKKEPEKKKKKVEKKPEPQTTAAGFQDGERCAVTHQGRIRRPNPFSAAAAVAAGPTPADDGAHQQRQECLGSRLPRPYQEVSASTRNRRSASTRKARRWWNSSLTGRVRWLSVPRHPHLRHRSAG